MKDSVAEVRDVRTLRALAHPLRLRLLALLRVNGPATASQLAVRVGQTSGSTSYHLRQLAAHGFVTELPDRGSARERWWQAAHRTTSWETADFRDQPGGEEVVRELTDRILVEHQQVLAAYAEQRETFSPEWADAASLNDHMLRLTAAQTRQFANELVDVLYRWEAVAQDPQPDHETVSVLIDLFPLRRLPL